MRHFTANCAIQWATTTTTTTDGVQQSTEHTSRCDRSLCTNWCFPGGGGVGGRRRRRRARRRRRRMRWWKSRRRSDREIGRSKTEPFRAVVQSSISLASSANVTYTLTHSHTHANTQRGWYLTWPLLPFWRFSTVTFNFYQRMLIAILLYCYSIANKYCNHFLYVGKFTFFVNLRVHRLTKCDSSQLFRSQWIWNINTNINPIKMSTLG